MSPDQRSYLHAEVIPAFAEGLDRLLVAIDQPPVCWSTDRMKSMLKWAFRIDSTEAMTDAQVADFITAVQAFAAECLIFIATPLEWEQGIAELEREKFYDYVLSSHDRLKEAA